MGDLGYLVIWIPAVLAVIWGWRRMQVVEPPAGPVYTRKLGLPVTDPEQRLAVHREKGLFALLFGVALFLGPLIAEAVSDAPATNGASSGSAP